MSSFKYSRLPTCENTAQFNALDGPSYFSYGVDSKKYNSAFTYSSLTVEPDQEDVHGKLYCAVIRILFKAAGA
jgi:hypothetical protein